MRSNSQEGRRDFLKTTIAGGLAVMVASRWNRGAFAAAGASAAVPVGAADAARTKVALTNGNDRVANIVNALKSIEKEIKAAIGNRRVVIKPNNVVAQANNQLAATHVDALAATCDFLKAIGKLEGAIIAESGTQPTMQGFRNLRYDTLEGKYNVKLVDLDQDKFETVMAFSQRDARPHAVRVSSTLTNQADNFIISLCMLKTHNYAVATMGIKNIILGAAMKLPAAGGGGGGGRGRGGGGMGGGSDKPTLHGDGSHGININLAMLAPLLHPSLTVIDGFQGMQGNGPISGTAVDHKVALASLDYLAADIVAAKLMQIDPSNIGYLTHLSQTNAGESDVSKMEIRGEPIEKLSKKYQLGNSIQSQMEWKNPAHVIGT